MAANALTNSSTHRTTVLRAMVKRSRQANRRQTSDQRTTTRPSTMNSGRPNMTKYCCHRVEKSSVGKMPPAWD